MTKREEYVQQLKGQLDQWNAEVTKWEAKARGSQASMRAEYEKQLATLRHQRDEATAHLQRIQAASGEAWVELVRGADDAWGRMRSAFEKARSHFQK